MLAVDAGADPLYTFADLEILTVRARNELGLSIEFRPGHIPEDVIRPKPSYGYSLERFAIADIYHLWDEIPALDIDENPIKDENYESFEVLVNYPDLKDAIKLLDYNGKLLVRIIFRVINEFQEVNELRNQLISLDINDAKMVKVLLNTMIFSQGINARTPGVKAVLAHAIEHESEKIKPILQKSILLSRQFKKGVKIPQRIIQHIIEDRLDEGIGSIEKIILEEMSTAGLQQVYDVMKTFLNLLSEIELGVEQKLINAYLLRKIEDDFFIKEMQSRGIPEKTLRSLLTEEPEDDSLIAALKNNNIDKNIAKKLFRDRDELRKRLRKQGTDAIFSLEDDKSFSKNKFKSALPLLKKVNQLLQETADDAVLIDQLKKELTAAGFPENMATHLIDLRQQQLPKVDQVMQHVSQRIEEQVRNDIKASTLVYIKSSVKAPKGKIVTDDETMYGAYKYKIYHPSFPHESTADQFFDPVQWEAYYMLGQYLGAEVLDVKGLDQFFTDKKIAPDFSIRDLLYRFDHSNEAENLFLYKSNIDQPATVVEMDRQPDPESAPSRIIVPSNDPEEELLKEVNQPNMKKKVVAGKDIDYTI